MSANLPVSPSLRQLKAQAKELHKNARDGDADPAAARIGRREIFVDARGAMEDADIYDFERLSPGNVVAGPAVIHTPITTIVVQDAQTGRMDEYRNIVIEFN